MRWLLPLVVATIARAQPDVVFLLVDDLGWRDVGFAGSEFHETPNIDRLATEGAAFKDAYAACPVCSPTRASIMTGKAPARLDTTDWFGAPQPDRMGNHRTRTNPLLPAPYVERLPLEETTIAELLKAKGYATGFFGKWHLGSDESHWPEHQGFDVNVGGWSRGSPAGGYFSPWTNPRLESTHEGEYLTERLASECASFIERQDGPYFAMLSFYNVHTPLQAKPELVERYRQKKANLPETNWGMEGERKVRLSQDHAVYAAMVHAMDEAVGVVLDAIEAKGNADGTIVIFFSDNGGLSTSEGHPTSNLPLRAGKGWLYEGGIREPCLIRWPGVTRPGSIIDTPISSIDFLPTIAASCGSSWPEVDGIDLRPVLQGEIPDRALFWHYPHYGNQGGSPGGAIRLGRYKLIEWYEPGREIELFDLATDLGETTNLASEKPDLADDLHRRLIEWREAVDAKMPTPNPNAK